MVTKTQAGTAQVSRHNPLTKREVDRLRQPAFCGNCRTETNDVLWHKGCQELLCGNCRLSYHRAIRHLTVQGHTDYVLGITGYVVKGTHEGKQGV